ncbi:hypothetical protein [Sphingomonas sp.]|uniref:hypothetical protein n=1 Tax=Sphingomonas sp. TaxID=28214 RepID=UPI0031CE21A6
MKTILLIPALAAGLLASAPALAHGNMKPQHGGVVQMAGETLFELVRSPAGVSIYVTDDDEPLASSAASGKIAVTTAGKTQDIVLRPGPANRFDAPGLKLAPGARLAVQVVEKATQARLGTTFLVP